MLIDITDKPNVEREAVAEGIIELQPGTLELIRENKIEKGDVIETAKLAALIGVKNTPLLIPHTHPIPITGTSVEVELLPPNRVKVTVAVKTVYKTGVEMEALNGVAAALLTIWDMVKKHEKDDKGQYPNTRITSLRVLRKTKR